MIEFAGIALAFAVIIYMINKKQSLALSMFIASMIVLIASGVSFEKFWTVILEAATDIDTIDLAVIVAIITSLAGLMSHYSFFDKMVAALRSVLGNDKWTLMVVPGLIGAMPMVGGAIVSAPIVDNLGDKLSLSNVQRSAANIIFRHSWYFIFPFIPTYLLATRLAGITIEQLLVIMWPLTAAMLLAGYVFILSSRVQNEKQVEQKNTTENEYMDRTRAGRDFAKYASPILVGLLLYLGMGIHLAISLAVGLLLAVFLIGYVEQPDDFEWSQIPGQLIRGINYEIVATMVAIMIFRAAVDQTVVFDLLMNSMLELGIPLIAITAALSAIIGFVSASHTSTLAVVIPAMMPMVQSMGANPAVYVMIAYCFAFLSYLISPLHLCQILTNDYFDVALLKVYKVYAPVVISVATTAILIALFVDAL